MCFRGEKTEHNFYKRSNKTLDVKCAIEHNRVIQERVILSRQYRKRKTVWPFCCRTVLIPIPLCMTFVLLSYFSNWRLCTQRLSTALVASAHQAWSEVLGQNVMGEKNLVLRAKQSIDLPGTEKVFCQLLQVLSFSSKIIMISNNCEQVAVKIC